jgi:ABC-type phosphate/phosphonate transport system substrate-binding protein
MIVASLPMYDWPEIRDHTDAFWHCLSHHAGLSGSLDRATIYDLLWKRPDLTFSQTCGYPFTHNFKDLLQYVATPHYEADGCDGAHYCSIILAREVKPLAEFYSSTFALNTPDSMSGMLAAKLVVAPFLKGGEFFRRTKVTGGHRNSLAAVRTKYADVCAIDSVCVALAKRYCPQELDGLVEIARSPMVPGLPYVNRSVEPQKLIDALEKTFADKAIKPSLDALLLKGFSVLDANAYNKITDLESSLPPFTL